MKTTMRSHLIVAALCLILGGVLGILQGSRTERRAVDERMATAVEAESRRAQDLTSEVDRLERSLALKELQLMLGRLALEADRQDYGTAGEQATAFFDTAATMRDQTDLDEDVTAALDHALAARDDITAGLATTDAEATERLKALFLEFSELSSEG